MYIYDVQITITYFLTYIVFVNFAFYCFAITLMFYSSILTRKSPVFSFQKLNRSVCVVITTTTVPQSIAA